MGFSGLTVVIILISAEKKNILELLKRRQDAQEQELKQNLKLEQDVEMEKLRKVKETKERQEMNTKEEK